MANVQKSEIKILTANNIGAGLEDLLESAKRNEQQAIGAKMALSDALNKVSAISAVLRKDIEDGAITEEHYSDLHGVERLIKRYIGRCVGVVDNLATASIASTSLAAGRVSALTKAMDIPKRVIEEESRKAKAIVESIEAIKASGEDEAMVGRPRLSAEDDIAQRRAEAAAKRNQKNKKKVRRCSKCKEEGHTARKCPATATLSVGEVDATNA